MAKMGKRQVIILAVMAIAILYAAFVYLAPNKKMIPGMDMTQKTADLNTFVTGLTASLGKESSKNPGSLIFSRAEKEWAQDPFLDSRSYKSWTQVKVTAAAAGAAAAPKIEFVYSGYLEVDRKRMAIINGMEYREGEGLDTKGYVLKSVSPESVVIENRGIGATVNVPLLE
jgi:type II secretory pathway component PulC